MSTIACNATTAAPLIATAVAAAKRADDYQAASVFSLITTIFFVLQGIYGIVKIIMELHELKKTKERINPRKVAHYVATFGLIVARILTFGLRAVQFTASDKWVNLPYILFFNIGFLFLFTEYALMTGDWIITAYVVNKGTSNKRTPEVAKYLYAGALFFAFFVFTLWRTFEVLANNVNTKYKPDPTFASLKAYCGIICGICAVMILVNVGTWIAVMVGITKLQDKEKQRKAAVRFTQNAVLVSVAFAAKHIVFFVQVFSGAVVPAWVQYPFLFWPEFVTIHGFFAITKYLPNVKTQASEAKQVEEMAREMKLRSTPTATPTATTPTTPSATTPRTADSRSYSHTSQSYMDSKSGIV